MWSVLWCIIGNNHERRISTLSRNLFQQQQIFPFVVWPLALGLFCIKVGSSYWPLGPRPIRAKTDLGWKLFNWPKDPTQEGKKGAASARFLSFLQDLSDSSTQKLGFHIREVSTASCCKALRHNLYPLFCWNGFGEGLLRSRKAVPAFYQRNFLAEIIWFTVRNTFPSGSCELLRPIFNWICRRSWAPGFYLIVQMHKSTRWKS